VTIRTIGQLRQVAGQANRRAMHCPVCCYPRFADPELAIGKGRVRQLCAGHSRDRYTASHHATLKLLAEVAAQLIEVLEVNHG